MTSEYETTKNEIDAKLKDLKQTIEKKVQDHIDHIMKSPNRDAIIAGIMMDRKCFLQINEDMERIILDKTKTDAEKIILLKGLCF